MLPWGKAYGLFNKKWLYISSVLLFEIGSAICGASPNMNALILGRVIAGVGGSGMYSGCLTYIAITTTAVERTLYMAGVAVTWGLGSVLGPVVGVLCNPALLLNSQSTGRRRLCDQQRHMAMGEPDWTSPALIHKADEVKGFLH